MPINPFARSILLTIIINLIFLAFQPFLSADQQTELWSGALMVACFWGVWRWGKTAWRAYKEGSSEPWHYGILAIVLLLLFLITWRFYGVIYVRAERPELWTRFPTVAYITYGITVAVVLFSLATRVDGEKPSKVMGVITAIGGAVALFASVLWPHLVQHGAKIARIFNGIF